MNDKVKMANPKLGNWYGINYSDFMKMDIRIMALITAVMTIGCFYALADEVGENIGSKQNFSENLLKNPSMENGGVGKPTDWEIVGDNSGGGLVWSEGNAYSGKYCLKVNAEKSPEAMWRSALAPCQPGKVYQGMAFLKPNKEAEFYHNPLELIFFTKDMKRFDPLAFNAWNKEMQIFPIRNGAWNLIGTRPVKAPGDAAYVCLEFKGCLRTHYAFHQPGIYYYHHQTELLLDNAALWETACQKEAYHTNPDGKLGELTNTADNYDKYLALTFIEGRPPVLPSANQPDNSVFMKISANPPGRIYFGKTNPLPVQATVYNLLGIKRVLTFKYTLVDWQAQVVGQGQAPDIVIPAYSAETVQLPLIVPPVFGSYICSYSMLDGSEEAKSGNFVFAVMSKKPEYDIKEQNDPLYPFSIMSEMQYWQGDDIVKRRAELLKYAGCLFDWQYIDISNLTPSVGQEELCKRVDAMIEGITARIKPRLENGLQTGINFVFPPGHIDDRDLPILTRCFERIVGKLKPSVKIWAYGGETIGDTQKDPDKIYNEKGMWKFPGNVKDFFITYKAAWEGAKKGDPECKFGLSFHNDPEAIAISHYYNLGYKSEMFDFIAINCYGTINHLWRRNYEVLAEHGAGDKSSYVPEVGERLLIDLDATSHKQADLKRATDIIKSYVVPLAKYPNLRKITWFRLATSDNFSICDPRDDGAETSFVAYCVMAQTLGAGSVVDSYSVDSCQAVRWRRPKFAQDILVAWSEQNAGMINLKVGSEVTVFDMMGNETRMSGKDGRYSLKLSPLPVYVSGKDIQVIKNNRIAIDVAPSTVQTPGWISIQCGIANNGTEIERGNLAVEPDRKLNIETLLVNGLKIPPAGVCNGENMRMSIPYTMPKFTGFVDAVFLSASGDAFQKRWDSGIVFATKTNPIPVLDGSWTLWNQGFDVRFNQASNVTQRSSAKWKGPLDLSAKIRFMWDSSYLYFGAEVADDIYVPPTDPQALFDGDAVELAFLSNQRQVEFDIGACKGISMATQTIPINRSIDAEVETYCAYGGKTIVYQAKIPWRYLGVTSAQPGGNLKFAMVIPDKDSSAGISQSIMLFNGISNKKDPSQFGSLYFVEAGRGDAPRKVVPMVEVVNESTGGKDALEAISNAHGEIELNPAPSVGDSLRITTYTRTDNPVNIVVGRIQAIAEKQYAFNMEYKLLLPKTEQVPCELKVIWLDSGNVDLGGKSSLFGFENRNMQCLLEKSESWKAVGAESYSHPGTVKASLMLSLPKTPFPIEIKMDVKGIKLDLKAERD